MSLPNSADSYDTYGGELQDYSPVEDPTTDLSAEASNASRSATSMMTRTCIKSWTSFTVSGGACTVFNNDAVYGNDFSVTPVVTYISPGGYTVNFPTSIIDPRGNTQFINIKAAWVDLNTASVIPFYLPRCYISAPNQVTIFLYDPVGVDLTDPSAPGDLLTLMVI